MNKNEELESILDKTPLAALQELAGILWEERWTYFEINLQGGRFVWVPDGYSYNSMKEAND